MTHDQQLLLLTVLAIAGLIALITWAKVPAFIALTVTSLAVGMTAIVTGLAAPLVVNQKTVDVSVADVLREYHLGLGTVLGGISAIIALGAIVGKLLGESGAAATIATSVVRLFGPKRLVWAVSLIAFVVGLSVFFAVGLVLLLPIVTKLADEAKIPPLRLTLPLVMGLSIAHGLVPPHPGLLAAFGVLHDNKIDIDLGRTILYSLVIGTPTVVLVCCLMAPALERWAIGAGNPTGHGSVALADEHADHVIQASREKQDSSSHRGPNLALSLTIVLLPIILILLGTAASWIPLPQLVAWLQLIGNPTAALLITVIAAAVIVNRADGFDRATLGRFAEESLWPVATILLVIGAGGGLNNVLVLVGVTKAVGTAISSLGLPPLVVAWVLAAVIRTATGSSTVSVLTAAGMLSPLVADCGIRPEWMLLSMGAGSLAFSHVNDGGFWLVKEFLGMTVVQTFKTWFILETATAVIALLLIMLLAPLT